MLTLNKMFVILIHGRKKQAIKGKSSLETGEKYGKNKTDCRLIQHYRKRERKGNFNDQRQGYRLKSKVFGFGERTVSKAA